MRRNREILRAGRPPTCTVVATQHRLDHVGPNEAFVCTTKVPAGVAVVQSAGVYDVKGDSGDDSELAGARDGLGQLPGRNPGSHPPLDQLRQCCHTPQPYLPVGRGRSAVRPVLSRRRSIGVALRSFGGSFADGLIAMIAKHIAELLQFRLRRLLDVDQRVVGSVR